MHPRAANFARCCSRLQLNSFYSVRHASSSSNPYPYPSNANPTPHQIFHLPMSASQKDVKSRYYELVRIYHPDSPVARVYPPEVSQARFHAISAAYDTLRGRKPGAVADEAGSSRRHDFHDLSNAVWRARQRQKAEKLSVGRDDRWKDSIIFGAIFLAGGVFILQTHFARTRAMNQSLHPPVSSSSREKSEAQKASASRRDEDLLAASESEPSPGSDLPRV
ncbi:hypothetical protein DENSPDRAFT_839258 [Dentipellis sp. KUC8613]|nr:hypothetical protein DENSPDRAFT_839258 [Dentipellis sp. KUC8613]